MALQQTRSNGKTPDYDYRQIDLEEYLVELAIQDRLEDSSPHLKMLK